MKELINQKFGASFKLELLDVCQRHEMGQAFCLRFEKKWTPSKLAAFGTYGNLQRDIESYYRANFDESLSFTNF